MPEKEPILTEEQALIIALAISALIIVAVVTLIYSINIWMGAVTLFLVLMGILMKSKGVFINV